MRIAITGGIACGKSLVAQLLRERHGIASIDADDIVHALIPPEERKALAKVVFADSAARHELESRIHPLVKARICEELANTRGRTVAIVPLLFEVHWEGDFDHVCCIACDQDLQIARMISQRGYTREEAEARIAAQMPIAEKTARADSVIVNAGTLANLARQVDCWVKEVYEQCR